MSDEELLICAIHMLGFTLITKR
jgi:ABC-type uncharacterized transport system permease subunit